MIRMLKAFTITQEYQERFGYPELTRALKSKILGLNGAVLYDVDPTDAPCDFTPRELEQIRRQLPGANGALGPRTMSQTRIFRDDDREQWTAMAEIMS